MAITVNPGSKKSSNKEVDEKEVDEKEVDEIEVSNLNPLKIYELMMTVIKDNNFYELIKNDAKIKTKLFVIKDISFDDFVLHMYIMIVNRLYYQIICGC